MPRRAAFVPDDRREIVGKDAGPDRDVDTGRVEIGEGLPHRVDGESVAVEVTQPCPAA